MKHSENILCRYCDSADSQKNGKDRGKEQRCRCKDCKKDFMLNYSYNACKKGVKEQIGKMLLGSSGTRDMGRVLNMSKDAVTAHIKKTGKVNPNYSRGNNDMEVGLKVATEWDELWPCAGSKADQRWALVFNKQN